ncbi:MAG: rod shape-determining protein MreD [Muribaculaceae bacterium]|nr:rod shape-determining protein MreD [Muribaculaceae bacterium]
MVLVQVLICNHIAIFDVAMPIVFIYFLIRLPISLGLSVLFTLAFVLGFTVDIFSDTPGVNALACTLLAALRRPVYYAYVPRDDKTKDLIPSISSLGVGTYSKYLVTLVGLYCFLNFSIEYFNFADIEEILLLSVSSSLLTFLALLAIDCLIITKS